MFATLLAWLLSMESRVGPSMLSSMPGIAHHQIFFLLLLISYYLCLSTCVPLSDSEPVAIPGGGLQPSQGRLFFQDHTPAGTLRVRAGEPFVLDCEAGGSPSPTVHFLRDGHRVIQVGADVVTM